VNFFWGIFFETFLKSEIIFITGNPGSSAVVVRGLIFDRALMSFIYF